MPSRDPFSFFSTTTIRPKFAPAPFIRPHGQKKRKKGHAHAMKSTSDSRGEQAGGGRERGWKPSNRQKTGSNEIEIQGPKRAWGCNPPPSVSTAPTQSEDGPGSMEPVTTGSGWGEAVTPHGAAISWGAQSSVSGWGEPASTTVAVGWGEPTSISSSGQETKTKHTALSTTDSIEHHLSPPSLDGLTFDHDVSSSQSNRGSMSSNILKDSGKMDSRATRKTYLDNLA